MKKRISTTHIQFSISAIDETENSNKKVSINNKSKESLNERKEIHDIRKNTCHICDKEVIGNKRLIEHIKNHKKSICKNCNKISSLQHSKRHLKSCKKEKVWLICTFCNFKAFDRTDLQKHYELMHYVELVIV